MSVGAIRTTPHEALNEAPVRLVDIDGEFLAAIPGAERQLAGRLIAGTRHLLPPGSWSPHALVEGGPPRPYAMLIQSGILVRDLVLSDRASGHLFGPGDVLLPWQRIESTLSSTSRWTTSADGAAVVVLDDRFARAAWKWPGLSAVIQQRLAEQLDASALRTAIVSLPRAEQRVLALFWQLADRWGTVTPAGVIVRLDLTHALIGRLIGARRPTVSLAIQALADEAILVRTSANDWCLAHESHRELDSELGTHPRPAANPV